MIWNCSTLSLVLLRRNSTRSRPQYDLNSLVYSVDDSFREEVSASNFALRSFLDAM